MNRLLTILHQRLHIQLVYRVEHPDCENVPMPLAFDVYVGGGNKLAVQRLILPDGASHRLLPLPA